MRKDLIVQSTIGKSVKRWHSSTFRANLKVEAFYYSKKKPQFAATKPR